MRPFCFDCRRARSTCICGAVVPFDAGFDLAICVHPREARNAIGTARIVHRFVTGSRIFVGSGESLDRDPLFPEWLRERRDRAWILYPSATAHWLDREGPLTPGTGVRPAFLLIDGTWAHAKKMLRTSELLRSLPQVAFTPREPSRYEIREQPGELCLSSLEAVHTLIDLNRTRPSGTEVPRPHDRMVDAFVGMVKAQLAFEAETRAKKTLTRAAAAPVVERDR